MTRSVRVSFAILLIVLAVQAFSISRTLGSRPADASSPAFDPLAHLVSPNVASGKLGFTLIVPRNLSSNLKFVGVYLQEQAVPVGFPTPVVTPTPTPPLPMATLYYVLTSDTGGSNASYLTLAEIDLQMPDVVTEISSSSGSAPIGSPTTRAFSPIDSQQILTIGGTKVAKTVATPPKAREVVDMYYWQHAGLTFVLQFDATNGDDQIATAIITGTL